MRGVKKARDTQPNGRPDKPVTDARDQPLRLRIVEPAIEDPAARQRAIRRATSRIKTTARIDTITGG